MTAASPAGAIRVDLPIPPGWEAVTLAPPDLSSTEQVELLYWQAWAPVAPPGLRPASLVAACFGSDTHAWTPEAEPIVLDRLGAVVSSTALRVAKVGGRRVVSTEHGAGSTSERIEGTGDAEGQLVAKTFLGFVDPGKGLVGCFALCTAALPDCATSVDRATVLADFVPAPAPTLAVRAVVAMAHHPSVTAEAALTFGLLAGVVAVVTRRRPRAK